MQLETQSTTNQVQQFHAVSANNEKALKLLYLTNYPKLEQYVLNNSGSTDEAKDIYQEAFIAVWRNIQLGRFQLHNGSSLDGYLFQVAKHKWLDHLRATKRRQMVALTDSDGMHEKDMEAEETELLQHIKKNLLLLGSVCQDLLKRFYYNRQSMRTIAADMDWTEATARNNKYRCLQRLRELVKNNRPNDE